MRVNGTPRKPMCIKTLPHSAWHRVARPVHLLGPKPRGLWKSALEIEMCSFGKKKTHLVTLVVSIANSDALVPSSDALVTSGKTNSPFLLILRLCT